MHFIYSSQKITSNKTFIPLQKLTLIAPLYLNKRLQFINNKSSTYRTRLYIFCLCLLAFFLGEWVSDTFQFFLFIQQQSLTQFNFRWWFSLLILIECNLVFILPSPYRLVPIFFSYYCFSNFINCQMQCF